MRQRLAQELLDEDAGTAAEVAASLADLHWIHDHLGGRSSWRRLLAAWPGAGSLLDVGAGRGQVAAAIGAQMHAHRIVALDRLPSHLGASGDRVAADAKQLPFADASFDVVMCNLFLHHFHGAAAVQLLQEMVRVARQAVLINDLERAWVPYLVIRALSPRFSRLTRYDGARSVAQAYTAQELHALAGARPHRVMRLGHYRLGLMVWCNRDG
ncbi:MAG: methyltransferase domain-containing protein [Terriglobales bacterium]